MDPKLEAIIKSRKILGKVQDEKVDIFLSRAKSGTYSRNRSSRTSNSKTFRNMQRKYDKNAQTLKKPELAQRKSRFVKSIGDYINGIPELAPEPLPSVEENVNTNNTNNNSNNENNKPAAKQEQQEIPAELLQAFEGEQVSPPRPDGEDECSVEPEGELFAVQDGETKDDGNCFYSAIFRAAKEQGILNKFPVGIITDNEERFIQTMRNTISNNISEGNLPKYKAQNGPLDTYNTLIQSDNSYTQIIRGFPEWFGKEFPKEKIGTRTEFITKLSKIVKEDKKWVGEIEVRLTKKLLKKNICLLIHNSYKEELEKERNGIPVINLHNYDEVHYKFFSFNVGTKDLVEEEKKADINQSSKVSVKSENPCAELFDPCTREPIANNDIKMLESRVREIRKNRDIELNEKKKFPIDKIINCLDLLIYILQQSEKPDEKLLQYDINGQLYESYWTIAITLGQIEKFPITEHFYILDGKIENISNINDPKFIKDIFNYLSSRKISGGSGSGASDITFMYKKQKINPDNDNCSAEIPVIPNVSEVCRTEVASASSRQLVGTSDKPLLYFCSSKFFKKDISKGIDKFDIQNIYTAAKNLNQDYDKKIILLVKDRGAVEEKMAKAIRKYIADEARYIFGMNDLFAALTKLYNFVHEKHVGGDLTKEKLQEILGIKTTPKPILNLRLHQHIAVLKITDSINAFKKRGSGNNKFLVGIVPRGGKTFIAGGIIHTLQPKKVVVLLGAKSETLSQFKDDLFEYFQNFSDYTIVDALDEIPSTRLDISKKYIILMSVELFKNPDSTRALLQNLKTGGQKADLFICDEAHLKQTTEKAVKAQTQASRSPVREEGEEKGEEFVSDLEEKDELEKLKKQFGTDVPVVYMTGTYIKPMTVFSIPPENCIIWDYQDIQEAKNLSTNEDYFKENFGEYYNRALNICNTYGESFESIQNQYRKFPELYLLTTQFTQDAKNAFLKQDAGKAIGYPTITHLFEIKKDFDPKTIPTSLWASGFTNPKGILRLMNYLSPSTASIKNAGGEKIQEISSVLTSVDHIAQRIGDRLAFFTSDFVVHSQLWFLPHMQGHPLQKRMCALAGAIFQSKWFAKNFVVIAVSNTTKDLGTGGIGGAGPPIDRRIKINEGMFTWACPKNGENLKQCLINEESKARRQGKGLIIIAQNMLHLGISLPCVDIVVLLDAGEKVDERIQKMYRALTESTNKKGGYIIDMNYFRTVTAIMNYQIQTETQRKKKRPFLEDYPKLFNKVLDIFSIDDDKPILRADIEKDTLPELQKLLGGTQKSGDSTVLSTAGAALDKNVINVLEGTYTEEYDRFLGLMKEEAQKTRALRELPKNSPEKATRAKEVKVNNKTNANDDYNEPIFFKEQDNKKQRKEAYLDIFKTTLKLGAFGTEHTNLKALIESLNHDEELKETLYDTIIKRGAIQEDKENRVQQRNFIIDGLIIPALRKIVGEGRDDSYQKMKESIDNNRKYPAKVSEVLEYIKAHLIPRDIERHKFGEVFTPMYLVEEMLDTLPAEVWQNKDLKWLDPANGMGNFPIGAFLRLFYGFRTKDGKFIGIGKEGDGKYNPGLTEVISGEETRRKHIVKDMLYMVEINRKNIEVSKTLFKKLAPGIEPNIIQMHRNDGFLADVEMKFSNGTVNQFDIIMGNPPFNKGSVRSAMVTSRTKKAKSNLGIEDKPDSGFWFKFVNKILTKGVLKLNGFLLFIHPITWFKPDEAGAHDLILSKQLIKIKIYKDDGEAQKLFEGKGKISIAYYLLENKTVSSKTRFEYADYKDKKEDVLLSTKSIIIQNYNSIYNKIILKCDLYGIKKGLKHKQIKECDDKGNNKLITILEEKGVIKYVNSSKPHPDQNTPKVIIGGTYTPIVLFDKKGEYGLYQKGQRSYFIGSELEKINDYFKTKLSTMLLEYVKFEQNFIKPSYFPDVRSINIKTINDDTLADYFEFTAEERKEIAKMHDPIHPNGDKIIKITCAQLRGEKEEPAEESRANARRRTRKLRRFF